MALTKIINLHASWCGPCKVFANAFAEVSEDEKNKDIKFERFDIEEDEGVDLTTKFHVRAVPTTLLLDEDDNEILKFSGAISVKDFQDIIDSHR